MVPLYAARVADLGPGDFVHVECGCGHTELLTATMLATAEVAPDHKVLDLERRLRCRECDELGRAVISIPVGESSGITSNHSQGAKLPGMGHWPLIDATSRRYPRDGGFRLSACVNQRGSR